MEWKTCYSIIPVKNIFLSRIYTEIRRPETSFFKGFRAEYNPMTLCRFIRGTGGSYRVYPGNTRVLSGVADPMGFEPAIIKNHDPDLFTSGKCPHAIVIDFLHVPEMIPGKIILNIRKK
jgi:hypothetical protein